MTHPRRSQTNAATISAATTPVKNETSGRYSHSAYPVQAHASMSVRYVLNRNAKSVGMGAF